MVTINSWNSANPAEVAKGGTGASTLTGVLTGNGTSAVTASTVTQYGTLVAGASNAVSSVAPSATSGVPLISQGSSSNPTYGTVAIAGGGTNATSYTQSAGIVVYNGTSLVNYAGPQINSSGVATNTAQPAFQANLSTPVTDVTGDSTTYTIIFDNVDFDQASNYNNSTGIFTAPVTGMYQFNANISTSSWTTSFTQIIVDLVTTGSTIELIRIGGGKAFESQSGSQLLNLSGSVLTKMTATNTAKINIAVYGSTKTIGVEGGSAIGSRFSGYLVC